VAFLADALLAGLERELVGVIAESTPGLVERVELEHELAVVIVESTSGLVERGEESSVKLFLSENEDEDRREGDIVEDKLWAWRSICIHTSGR